MQKSIRFKGVFQEGLSGTGTSTGTGTVSNRKTFFLPPPQSRQHTLGAQAPVRGVPPQPSPTCTCAKTEQGTRQGTQDKEQGEHVRQPA